MKLRVLLDNAVDNNTGIVPSYFAEPALSFYIEDEDVKILFDMGFSGIFIDNAKIMAVDLNEIDVICFSHGHDDHTSGFVRFLREKKGLKGKIVSHEGVFQEKREGGYGHNTGFPLSIEVVRQAYTVEITNSPIKISPNITYLGEIPSSNDYEIIEESLREDSALVYENDEGLYIITGCSHSGICNICEYAKTITGKNKILGIIGGLHLFNPQEEKTKKTIEYLKKENIPNLHPSHCTSFEVRATMYNECNAKNVLVGMEFNW